MTKTALLAAAAAAALLAACSSTGAIAGLALNMGRKLLVDTAQQNYGPQYSGQVDTLLATFAPGASPGATAPTDAGARPPIELEATVLRELVIDGRPVPVAVEDGDVLRDGVGRDETGDNLKLRFSTNVDCHVYALWVDATAWVTPLFPTPAAGSVQNPVAAGATVALPAGDDWFYLDDYRGVETLYLVASYEPLPELESALAGFVGLERAFLSDTSQAATLDEPEPVMRGVAGVRPGTPSPVQSSDGAQHQVAAQIFAGQFAGSDLVVTRWFRHE